MTAIGWLLAASALIVAGMAAIAWAMPRHHELLDRPPPTASARRRARRMGWPMLAMALVPCVAGWGGSIGSVLWIGLLSVGVLVIAGIITVRGARRRT